MTTVEITRAADRDLQEIYRYTFLTHGERQADRYLEGLDDCFRRLAEHPFIGRSAERLRPGYRRFEYGAHVVFFISIDRGIRVVRVLHQRMEPQQHL
jgi:toxin ParE1/3/4